MRALLDSNILIDYLNGVAAARDEIRRHEQALISLVTWMEVLIGTRPHEEVAVRAFLQLFSCIGIGMDVAERAVALR